MSNALLTFFALPGSPTSSRASPSIPRTASMNCCPGTGRQKARQPLLVSPDHAHQQGLPRHDDQPSRQELGENENWLFDVAVEMEPEDGLIWVIWVHGITKDGVMALTDFGIMHKADPTLLKR
jgi:hypothetical protein